jgi:hypothetical protein
MVGDEEEGLSSTRMMERPGVDEADGGGGELYLVSPDP